MDVYVSQDEFKYVNPKDRIYTEGAGPCIIVGIYDNEGKIAYLIHEEFASMSDILDDFIETVRAKSQPVHLKAYVRGGSIFSGIPKAEKNDLLENRELVLKKLQELLQPNQIDCQWAENNSESKMLIDADTGRVDFDFEI